MRRSSLILFLTLLVLAVSNAADVSAATFLRLGDLSGGLFSSGANGVSADGSTVVGVANSAPGSEAFRWTLADGMIGLGDLSGGTVSSGAWNVSADGRVVVGTSSSTGGAEAFRWSAETGMVGLGDLAGGPAFSVAHGVSADGSTIVGYGHTDAGQEAFRWTSQTGMVSLGDFAGGDRYSAAAGISADGSVVVGLGSSDAGIEAFRWTSAGGLVGLGGIPGGSHFSGANGVSADASMVVGVDFSNLPGEAFVWSTSTGLNPLGLLPDAGSFDTSQAYDVSVLGHVVVGYASSPGEGNVAIVWDETHGLRRVDELLSSLGVELTGWRLTEATGISDNGQVIVGRGFNPSGFGEAWVAIVPPLANPTNAGDANNDGRVDRADLAVMLSHFGSPTGAGFFEGDLNADGGVSMTDVMLWRRLSGTVYAESQAVAVSEPASTMLALLGLLTAVSASTLHRRAIGSDRRRGA